MKIIKIEIKWALFFSLMTLAWMLLEKFSGLHDKYIDYHIYLTNLFLIPAIIFIVLALNDKKQNFYNNEMNYKQGLISGIIVSVIIACLAPFTQYIITYLITPEYFPNVIKRSVEIGYFENKAIAEDYFNYKNYAKQSTISSFFIGIITSVIAMIFIRTK